MTILHTARTSLREFTAEDADSLLRIFSHPEAMRYSPMPLTQELSAAVAFISWQGTNYERFSFGAWAVIDAAGQFLGHAGLIPHEIGTELFYAIVPERWGLGLATEVACACRDHAFQNLDLKRLIAIIHPDHTRAIAVAAKVGMTEAGMIRFWNRDNRLFTLARTGESTKDTGAG